MEQQLESALQDVEKVTENGGYMKKETKEELQQAVRTIRNYIKTLKAKLETKVSDKKNHQNKVTNSESEEVGEPDSWPEGQVAPSLGRTFEAANRNRHSAPPTEEKEKHQVTTQQAETAPSQKAHDQEPGSRGTNQTPATVKTINDKLENIIDFLENKLDEKIEQKINQRLRIKNPTKNYYSEKTANDIREDDDANTADENKRNYKREIDRKGRDAGGSRPHTIDQRPKKEEWELEAAEKMAWLYIGRLKQSTTTINIRKFLERYGITGKIECEELHTLGDRKAFKIGIPYAYLEDAQSADFWPQGITVRRYRFRRNAWRQDEDIGAEVL